LSAGKRLYDKFPIRRWKMEEDIKRILVVSRIIKNCRAIHYGISMARKYGAKLTIVHIIHNPFGLEGWNVPMMSLEKDYENLLEEAKTDLEEIVKLEKGKGLPIKKLIREGEPTAEILKVVNEEKIDLLIACHDEESRLEHFLFCRSNEELIRQMPCSIMLVKNEKPLPLW
jgi:universal stress protein A